VGGGLGAAAGDFGFGNLWRRKGHKAREVLKFPVWRSGSGGRIEPFSFFLLPPFNYPRPILKSENSIYARSICVFALENAKSTLWAVLCSLTGPIWIDKVMGFLWPSLNSAWWWLLSHTKVCASKRKKLWLPRT
jgi:hypothetical protein